jgi:UDP-2,4-diacetamido-2,4,6-trideoxy-beta-L-altropyranose hydrolase
MGHVKRCLALSEHLKNSMDCKIAYLMHDSDVGEKTVLEYGYITMDTFPEEKVDIIITSLPQLSDEYMEELRLRTVFLVCLDDSGRTYFSADIVVRGSIVEELRTCDSACRSKFLLGQDYMALDKQFQDAHNTDRVIQREVKSILVTMGGSDINDFTTIAMDALEKLDMDGIEKKVVVGSAFKNAERLMRRKGFKFEVDVSNMAELMMNADIIIAGGGMILYELACVGTPGIALCQTDYQEMEGRCFEQEGVVINSGGKEDITKQGLAFEITSLIGNYGKRKEMAACGKRLIEGKAIYKISNEIKKEFTK